MIELIIDNLAIGGRGVGRHGGKAVFVPGTLPGETVRCRPVREKRRYCEAELVEVLSPAAERVAPACPVFGDCGGCQWQHLSYAGQLSWKERLFREALTRSFPLDEGLFRPIVASPSPWNYRCRAQIKCRATERGFVAGFYRSGTHYVVDIDSCPLLDGELNRLFAALKPLFSAFPAADRVPQLDLAVDDCGRLSLIVHFLGDDIEPLRALLAPVAARLSCTVHVQKGRKETLVALFGGNDRPEIFPDTGRRLGLAFPPGGFVQVNLGQNRALVAGVAEHVPAGGRVLDLFCGIGNFSLPLAVRAVAVVGVEDYAPAIAAASANARRHGIANAIFNAADARRWLPSGWGEGFDTVLLDPPRSGAYEVVRHLVALRPKRIVYVSCDPMTLSRDLQLLLHNGYEPLHFRPYDMFPQTAHIEGVAVLQRRSDDHAPDVGKPAIV